MGQDAYFTLAAGQWVERRWIFWEKYHLESIKVECLFSSLAFIFTDLKDKIKGTNLANIVFCRENKDLFDIY